MASDAATQAYIRLLLQKASASALDAYLVGAAHDGTRNSLHGTLRICQASRGWIEILEFCLALRGARAWIYREGQRDSWVVETSYRLAAVDLRESVEARAFARGYFDAEGGVPASPDARFYIQFVQKDLGDLLMVRDALASVGIACGVLHNPSVRVDPDYWRFYVRCGSHLDFIDRIGSWHPRKLELLRGRRRGSSRRSVG